MFPQGRNGLPPGAPLLPASGPIPPSRGANRNLPVWPTPFVQNLGRGHYELGIDTLTEQLRVSAGFDELAQAI